MGIDIDYRRKQARLITNRIGCYALCDLDGVPIYVGQSRDGIRSRVNRHLTSARSDVIANRQVDVWEIAYVWTYPVDQLGELQPLEDALVLFFDAQKTLMNGKLPSGPMPAAIPEPAQKIQVMIDHEISEKRDPVLRLPRQAEHFSQIVGHFLAVKRSKEIQRAIQAHFDRLATYHDQLQNLSASAEPEARD
jgi:hypothetical protein